MTSTRWREHSRMDAANIESYRDALEYALGIPFVGGNRLTALQNGDQIFPAMLEAIDAAKHRVDFVTFVYWSGRIADKFADALASAASRDVRVRVLLDAFGCKSMEDRIIGQLVSAGVEVRWFRPLSTFRIWRIDKRTHRKILVVDDAVGFTGGVGIADEWTGQARDSSEWRDTHLRIEGPAAVGLRAALIDNWNASGDWVWDEPLNAKFEHADDTQVQVVRSASTIGWTDMAAVIRSLIALSAGRIRLVTAYFVPDPPTLKQLIEAIERGVKVELLVPGKHTDSRLSQLAGNQAVEQLLCAGASIWQYEKTMLHAKTVVVDDLACCIGSPNLNRRSMGKDEECCVIALSRPLAAQLNDEFDRDCQDATQMNFESWRRRGWALRLQERAARVLIEHL